LRNHDQVSAMAVLSRDTRIARRVRVRGVVQGVGFRPHVYRLARAHGLDGWVLNGDAGVEIHVEGAADAVAAFDSDLLSAAPPASQIAAIAIEACALDPTVCGFEIRDSISGSRPTTRVSPDLSVCEDCVSELLDPADRRYRYAYINCTNCGPRFSIVRGLPYDRARTTMADWPLCPACANEYHNPGDRRFHAQPVACAECGPSYYLVTGDGRTPREDDAIERAARMLREGAILAVKGIGGYHLVCDADNAQVVAALRQRKYRKEQAFAVMVRDEAVARETVQLSSESGALLTSAARPIVLAPAIVRLPGVAPDNADLGVMLPYAPLHHLLFMAGAPRRLVVTSGNRSSEPIVFRDEDARDRLASLADAFLVGARPIARRVEDSVVKAGPFGCVVIRRSRGLAPSVAATLPASQPILALGADLKNTVTLVVDGQAYVSPYIGDLAHADARSAFDETIRDLLSMYAVALDDLIVAHDRHPDYVSTAYAQQRDGAAVSVQHHRAHVASVLAERGEFDRRVIGIALDGTGFGDDAAIWGGEFFVGSIAEGFERVAHLRQAALVGGDAAARCPVQAAAGFLTQVDDVGDFSDAPFNFPPRYRDARAVLLGGVRVFPTTSAGRLFDTVAALAGFTRLATFEGQAAMWLEHLARAAGDDSIDVPCRFSGGEVDWRDTLAAIVGARRRDVPLPTIARGFHRAFARAMAQAACELAAASTVDTIVLSGGVAQNQLLMHDILDALGAHPLTIWTNRHVPPNDGGISLGQAAIAAFTDRPV
jgi:hydrogenase maturation protein HypF